MAKAKKKKKKPTPKFTIELWLVRGFENIALYQSDPRYKKVRMLDCFCMDHYGKRKNKFTEWLEILTGNMEKGTLKHVKLHEDPKGKLKFVAETGNYDVTVNGTQADGNSCKIYAVNLALLGKTQHFYAGERFLEDLFEDDSDIHIGGCSCKTALLLKKWASDKVAKVRIEFPILSLRIEVIQEVEIGVEFGTYLTEE